MIYSTFCIGDQWVKTHQKAINEFGKSNTLFVLTNQPNRFKNCNTVLYEKNYFSYYEKIIFIFNLLLTHKQRITFIDANKVYSYNTSTNYPGEYIYTGQLIKMSDIEDNFFTANTNDTILKIFNHIGVNRLGKEYIREHILSIPYFEYIEEAFKDILLMQPYIEKYFNKAPNNTNLERYSKFGVGYGEGLSLLAISQKYRLEVKQVDWKKIMLI